MPRPPADPDGPERAHAQLVQAFQAAVRSGCDRHLALVLGADVRVLVDAGGTVRDALPPASGTEDALALIRRALGESGTLDVRPHPVNGRLALVCRREERVVAVVGLRGLIGQVDDVWIVVSPEKLAHWNASGSPAPPARLPADT